MSIWLYNPPEPNAEPVNGFSVQDKMMGGLGTVALPPILTFRIEPILRLDQDWLFFANVFGDVMLERSGGRRLDVEATVLPGLDLFSKQVVRYTQVHRSVTLPHPIKNPEDADFEEGYGGGLGSYPIVWELVRTKRSEHLPGGERWVLACSHPFPWPGRFEPAYACYLSSEDMNLEHPYDMLMKEAHFDLGYVIHEAVAADDGLELVGSIPFTGGHIVGGNFSGHTSQRLPIMSSNEYKIFEEFPASVTLNPGWW